MNPSASPSVEISIAMLSWINDQLRESAFEEETRRVTFAGWVPPAMTILAFSLCGACCVVLHQWT